MEETIRESASARYRERSKHRDRRRRARKKIGAFAAADGDDGRHPRQPSSKHSDRIASLAPPSLAPNPLRSFPGCKPSPAIPLVIISSHLRTTSSSNWSRGKRKKTKEIKKQNLFFFSRSKKERVERPRRQRRCPPSLLLAAALSLYLSSSTSPLLQMMTKGGPLAGYTISSAAPTPVSIYR